MTPDIESIDQEQPDLPADEVHAPVTLAYLPLVEWALAAAFLSLFLQLLHGGSLSVKRLPIGIAGLIGAAALATLLISRFDVSCYRIFVPRKREEVELAPMPSWLEQTIGVAIGLVAIGFFVALLGYAGASFSGIATAVGNWPRWAWFVINGLILLLAVAWRALVSRSSYSSRR